MTPLGHMAVAWILVDGTRGRPAKSGAIGVLGALAPDLLDKPARALRFTHGSRWVGHGVFTWLLVWAAWRLLKGRGSKWARPLGWFSIGGTSHIAVDLVNDILIGTLETGSFLNAWLLSPFFEHAQVHLLSAEAPLSSGITPHVLEIAISVLFAAILLEQAIRRRAAGPPPQDSPSPNHPGATDTPAWNSTESSRRPGESSTAKTEDLYVKGRESSEAPARRRRSVATCEQARSEEPGTE